MPRQILSYGSTSQRLSTGQLYRTDPLLSLTINVEGGFVIVDGNEMGQIAHVPYGGLFELVQTAKDDDEFKWRIDFHWNKPPVAETADSKACSPFKADTMYLNMHADVLKAYCVHGYVKVNGINVGPVAFIPKGATYEFKAIGLGFYAQACDAKNHKPDFGESERQGGSEWRKRFYAIKRYNFLLGGSLGGAARVQKWENQSGDWIEHHEASTLVDSMRSEMSGLYEEIAHLKAELISLKHPTVEACREAPDGWQCTRVAGHEGPCAAKATAL